MEFNSFELDSYLIRSLAQALPCLQKCLKL